MDKGAAQHTFKEIVTAPAPSRPGGTFFPVLTDPGVYYLVTVWSPRVLDMSNSASPTLDVRTGQLGEVYATARSLPVRIEVAPNANQ